MRVANIKLKITILVGTVCLFVCYIHYIRHMRVPALRETEKENGTIKQFCLHPDLDPNNPIIKKFITDLGQLNCERELDWLNTKKGWLSIDPTIVKRHGKINCYLSYIIRVDDNNNIKDKEITFTSDDGPIKLKQDFFLVRCKSENNNLTWKNLMAGIHRNDKVVQQAKSFQPPGDSMKLNVLMFGFDSMSRLHYIRKLPKTYNYLTNVLNATILKGYNIIGDGTPAALIPILTGFTELELPETRKRMKNANFVNIYPFVWKNFASNGYVTVYGEDSPSTGTFMYRLKGFNDQPTDHYMRPFYLEVNKVLQNHPKYCLGNTPRHKVMLNYFREFFDVYSDVPKFGFLHHSELSHNYYNPIGYADKDTEAFLRKLHKDGILNNTLLICMSDHGHRYIRSIRETQQGKQEERLPFFSIVVPPWFEKKYPVHTQNLRLNSNRLVVPFDLYSTFLSLLNPDVPTVGNISSRSISLFSEIPLERTCADADVEPHWCACLSWISVLPSDQIVQQVGQAMIDFINDYTSSQRSLCVQLVIDEVTRIEKLQPNLALLKFKKNTNKDGFVGDFTDNTQLTEVIYQVQLKVFPSLGIYEASLKYNPVKKSFHLNERDISRINMYGNQEHCIHDTYPNMRKYCYCKEQLS